MNGVNFVPFTFLYQSPRPSKPMSQGPPQHTRKFHANEAKYVDFADFARIVCPLKDTQGMISARLQKVVSFFLKHKRTFLSRSRAKSRARQTIT